VSAFPVEAGVTPASENIAADTAATTAAQWFLAKNLATEERAA